MLDSNQYRPLFELPEEIHYLNCAYMSPQLKSVSEVGKKSLAKKEQPWLCDIDDFVKPVHEARSRAAQLFGCENENIAFIPSAAYGLATAAANVYKGQGKKVILRARQFPSNVYCWMEFAKNFNLDLIFTSEIPANDPTDELLSLLDSDVAVLAFAPYHWADGLSVQLEPVLKRAQELEVATVLDLTQSLGAVPFNIKDYPCDFAISALYKWGLSPYTTGIMYASEKYFKGLPIEFSWQNRIGAEDHKNLVNYTDDYQSGAVRFDMGEKSQFIKMPMVAEALKFLLETEVERICETIRQKTDHLQRGFDSLGFKTINQAHRAPHILGVDLGNSDVEKLQQKLSSRQVHVSFRGSYMRVSPHIYNNHRDLEALLSVFSD